MRGDPFFARLSAKCADWLNRYWPVLFVTPSVRSALLCTLHTSMQTMKWKQLLFFLFFSLILFSILCRFVCNKAINNELSRLCLDNGWNGGTVRKGAVTVYHVPRRLLSSPVLLLRVTIFQSLTSFFIFKNQGLTYACQQNQLSTLFSKGKKGFDVASVSRTLYWLHCRSASQSSNAPKTWTLGCEKKGG